MIKEFYKKHEIVFKVVGDAVMIVYYVGMTIVAVKVIKRIKFGPLSKLERWALSLVIGDGIGLLVTEACKTAFHGVMEFRMRNVENYNEKIEELVNYTDENYEEAFSNAMEQVDIKKMYNLMDAMFDKSKIEMVQ